MNSAISGRGWRPRWRHPLVLIFVIAFVIRAGIGLSRPAYRELDDIEVNYLAKSVAHGHGFAYPFSETVSTGPSALNSPLYVLFRAVLFRLVGTGVSGGWLLILVSCFFSALLCAALGWLGETAGLSARVSFGAAFVAALVPVHQWLEIKGTYEHVWAALCVVFLTGMLLGEWREKTFHMRRAVWLGVFAGAGVMAAASVLAALVGLLLAGVVLLPRQKLGSYVRYAGVILVTMLLLQTPWAFRNWKVLGTPVLFRDAFGLELWASNNPESEAGFAANETTGFRYAEQPFVSQQGLLKLQSMGEVAFFDLNEKMALDWIRRNPGRFLHLTAERIVLFWFPNMVRLWQTVFRALATILATGGLALLLTRKHPLGYAAAGVFFFYPLVYYLASAQDRFSYPIYPLEILLAVYAVVSAVEKYRKQLPG